MAVAQRPLSASGEIKSILKINKWDEMDCAYTAKKLVIAYAANGF